MCVSVLCSCRLFEQRAVEQEAGAASSEPAKVTMQGVLLKRKRWLGTWHERLFILTGAELAYAYPVMSLRLTKGCILLFCVLWLLTESGVHAAGGHGHHEFR